MGNKSALQLEVEKEMGFEIDEDLFAYLEHYARRKLEVANKSAGRAWGEDGYGDEYLSLLIPDVIREMAFSAYCDQRSAENLAARKAVKIHGQTQRKQSQNKGHGNPSEP